ncbi:MAG: M16 family metallopeptidase, partial [Gemmatimonadales bacterium]
LSLLEAEGWFAESAVRAPNPSVAPEPALRGEVHQEVRDTTQSHIVIATDTFPYRDSRRFALAILINIFGGGMSSRLFQRVREELGLAYAIYAYQSLHRASGVSGVYVGTHPGTADRAVEAILAEYALLAREALTEAELAEGKQQLKGQVLLSLESPAARMNRLATIALHEEPYRNLDELRATIDAVTLNDVRQVAAEFFAPERQILMRLGPASRAA